MRPPNLVINEPRRTPSLSSTILRHARHQLPLIVQKFEASPPSRPTHTLHHPFLNDRRSKQIVIDIINEIAPDEDTTDLKGDVSLRDQMDLDSMDFLDIVMELRKQHGIEGPRQTTRARLTR